MTSSSPPAEPAGDGDTAPLADTEAEAARILDAAEGLPMRLMGGVAVALLTPNGRLFPRTCQDIDFFAAGGSKSPIVRLFRELGYAPDEPFNAMRGHRRLMFWDTVNERQLDVFVGQFDMCHNWPLENRVAVSPRTLPPADILLTKLQIFSLNEKDLRDILNLLHRFEVTGDDADAINGAYIAELCAADWGLWRTVTLNLERCRSGLEQYDLDQETRTRLRDRIDALQRHVDSRAKSTRWRLRARVGERVKWYQEPEEVH